MEDRLKYIFGIVNDWLKFAETKNAALVVAVCAASVPICDHFPSTGEPWSVRWFCSAGCVLFGIAGFLSLGTFLPRLIFTWSESKAERSATHNLLYFGHIAKYSAADYLKALYDAELTTSPNRKLELDLAGQIVINSQITNKKFKQFAAACYFALAGIAAFVVSVISYACK
jgi:Family of unknown function (DUF5706)